MEEGNNPPSSIPLHTRHLSRPLNIPTLSGDEYLWEWGGFPQKSPLNTAFGSPGILEALSSGRDKDKATTASHRFNSPLEDNLGINVSEEEGGYGTGGRLRPDRNEPHRFILLIERKTIYFELGLFPKDEPRRNFGRNEVDDAQIFNERRIDYKTFLDDESIFQEGDLVIRWAGDRWVLPVVHWRVFPKSNCTFFPGILLVPMDRPSWTFCQSGDNRRSNTGTMGQFPVHRPLPRV